jgi:hypothetical protein
MKCTGFHSGEVAGLRRENYYPELKGVYTTSSVNSAMRKVVNWIKTTGSGKEYKAERPMKTKVEIICAKMGRISEWLTDIKLQADGYETMFYKKD